LPQTVFYCPDCKGHRRRRRNCKRCEGYGKLTRDSVQELIARELLPAYRARMGKFHGAGREDIDVRMLGAGRPFVFEVVGARVLDVDVERQRARIHELHGERIQLDPFVSVSRDRIAYWKERKLDKTYRAEVVLASAAAPAAVEPLIGRSLDIRQRTPSRVAHRRADLERERRVDIVDAELLEPTRLRIDVRCVHGTYVKEWISGDDERTQPSLAELLETSCTCELLDVLDIHAND
jgi:tRNA pseudouridine synthase 10